MNNTIKPTDINAKPLEISPRRICTAPMMEWSDPHCRVFWRLLTKHTFLYTEMVTTGAILYGNNLPRFLNYNDVEHPIALQLGGSNPNELAQCGQLAKQWGYDEINLNVGCPSDRVQNNMIGACLMAHPTLVSDCIKAMLDIGDIKVSIKHRIGIDDMDSYDELCHFIHTVADTGCQTFIIHARKAILKGLSPKENREIPPLKYDWVYRLKQEFPHLEIIINGGISTYDSIDAHLQNLDGVMIGREAYHNPYMLVSADNKYYHHDSLPLPTRQEIVHQYFPYIEQQLKNGLSLGNMSRHILGIFHAQKGARLFRRHISENAHKKGACIDVIEKALTYTL
jgi:tRNA-dihydrouridine synthase A